MCKRRALMCFGLEAATWKVPGCAHGGLLNLCKKSSAQVLAVFTAVFPEVEVVHVPALFVK